MNLWMKGLGTDYVFMTRGRSMQPVEHTKSSPSHFSLPAQTLRGQHLERRERFAHQEEVRHG